MQKPTTPGSPKRRFAIRARSFLVWLLVFFLLGYLVLDALVDRVPETMVLKVNDPAFWDLKEVYGKRLSEVRDLGGPSVLMLGSSKTQFGFRGEVVEAAMNTGMVGPRLAFGFALPGMGPLYQWTCAKRLGKMGLLPDIILLEVHGALFVEDSGNSTGVTRQLGWLPRDRVMAREWMDYRRFGVSSIPQGWMGAGWYEDRFRLLAPLRILVQSIDSGPKKPRGSIDRWGGPRLPTEADADNPRVKSLYNLEKTREEYAEIVGKPLCDPDSFSDPMEFGGPGWVTLDWTIKFLRDSGCHVILVRMPEGPAFRSWYAPNLARKQELRWMSLVGHDKKHWIDAWEWLREDKFWDSNHLNPQGAKIFSERLGRHIGLISRNDK